MQTSPVLKSQKNEVYAAISSSGFDASEFQWRQRNSTIMPELWVSELVHKSLGYYFIFDWSDANMAGSKLLHWAQFSPGSESIVDREFPGSWKLQLGCFNQWLSHLRRELDAPDLWSDIAQQTEAIEAISDAEAPNTILTLEERHYIAERLYDISHQIATEHNLSEYQVGQLEAQVAYLVDSSERSGRRDWTLMALGVLTNVMLMGTIPPDAGRRMFQMMAQVFHQLLTQGHALLQ